VSIAARPAGRRAESLTRGAARPVRRLSVSRISFSVMFRFPRIYRLAGAALFRREEVPRRHVADVDQVQARVDVRRELPVQEVAESWAAKGLPVGRSEPHRSELATVPVDGKHRLAASSSATPERNFPAYVDTGLNLVDVRGRGGGAPPRGGKGPRRRAIYPGKPEHDAEGDPETLSRLTGSPAPRVRLPPRRPAGRRRDRHLSLPARGAGAVRLPRERPVSRHRCSSLPRRRCGSWVFRSIPSRTLSARAWRGSGRTAMFAASRGGRRGHPSGDSRKDGVSRFITAFRRNSRQLEGRLIAGNACRAGKGDRGISSERRKSLALRPARP